MVKSKFPGKPSKHFQRRKVSPGINIEDFEGLKAAEEIYCRLSVFDLLFREEDEVSSFHGFSPHEINLTHKSLKKNKPEKEKIKGKKNCSGAIGSTLAKNIKGDVLKVDKVNGASLAQTYENVTAKNGTNLSDNESSEESLEKKTDNVGPILPLSGKFILPTRSAHSSRVIKPNKRFIQSEGISLPNKKQRLKNDVEEIIQSDNVPEDLICSENSSSDKCHSNIVNDKSDNLTNSPMKFVLRKPRLKIKTQSISTVEGPFSSPSTRCGPYEGSKHQTCQTTKVVCGVCWTVRSYKFLKQARKFGIFACEPCRRFILKVLKMEREGLLKPIICLSGTGNCQIRNSAFVNYQPFATPPKKFHGDGPRRCQGCWLHLCVRSFKMPTELSKRLASYLPNEILQKYPISSMINNWSELANRCAEGKNEVVKIVNKKKPVDENKKVRNRQKLLLAGPRVKHVCRSASLVLGQPTATFLGSSSKGDMSNQSPDDDVFSTKSNSSLSEINGEIGMESEGLKKQDLPLSECLNLMKDKNSSLEKPVARMLQDLGRANCELLDGIELHETEKKFAKISIDFWETYDPEEVLQTGFPLLGFNPFSLRAVCFLCGSAGFEKLVHCACCCEPYHTFCVSSNLHFSSKDKNWWKLDWLCPKCTHCEKCFKAGGTQLMCSKCSKSYHSNCIPPGRAHISDNSWVCPSCLFCKSCNDTQVHVFIGNVPLCKNCFKQRKKGNFCPLCQRCYDENDYSTKMMECSDCKCWIHAKCEGLSDEKYQVLSNLPSTIEFVCRDCCKDPPALWSVAVNAELKAGYLNVIRSLSKNRSICSYLKASPNKRVCVCQDIQRKPIHLKNLSGQSEISLPNNTKSFAGSPITITDEKNADLGLLTPKLTKDDEESLQTVKTEFLNLVTNKDVDTSKEITMYSLSEETAMEIDDASKFNTNKSSQLLSIACDNSDSNIDKQDLHAALSPVSVEKDIRESVDRICSCLNDSNSTHPLSLMVIKNKAICDDYASVLEFNRDVEKVIKEIERPDILKIYYKSLRQIFPWFDPRDSTNNDCTSQDLDSVSESKLRECRKSMEGGELESLKTNILDNVMNGLLHHEQDYYYIGVQLQDSRMCMLCKLSGEGLPTLEGRLLYCGQNEWVHVNCALWSSEVFEEIDGSLQNVHSAISRARLIRCFRCDKKGASVGCCARSCPSAYHFSCAISASCVFLENKEVFCKVHKNLSSAKEVQKEEDFLIARSVYVELDHKKKKDVLRNEVRLYVGALSISSIGEIVPELSDMDDIIVPCEFKCSRLYWSIKEPWRLVRYHIKTTVTTTYHEHILESDTNYTVDHSLDFTPPPSPVEEICQYDNIKRHSVDEKDIKLIVNHIIDTICSREEDNNISEHSNTDLLPPELKEAIFEDLPHDLLDDISMHDIFTKMNFDDILSEVKHDKMETVFGESSNVDIGKRNLNEDNKRQGLLSKSKFLKHNSVKNPKKFDKANNSFFRDRRTNSNSIKQEQFLNKVKENSWKPCRLLQVDGAVDFSESDQSDDSCDMIPQNTSIQAAVANAIETVVEDKPVKCARCHRTYRTSVGYDRHLSTCNSQYLSSTESDSSEEEREKPNNLVSNAQYSLEYNSPNGGQDSDKPNFVGHLITNGSTQVNGPQNMIIATPHSRPTVYTIDNPAEVSVSSQVNGISATNNPINDNINHLNNGTQLDLNFKHIRPSLSMQVESKSENHLTARPLGNFINHTSERDPIVEIENTVSTPPTIILQQMPAENVLPTYIHSYPQNSQQSIQYITSIENHDKFISTSHLNPGTFHLQSAQSIHQPVVQNVPTVVGAIIQTNGVEQIVLNSPNPSLEMYTPQQSNVYIANTPMIVGMETVVSNTVMSSSQFISASVPGMLAASSYSATTTQVFQATKPVIDIPQSYVVVNTNPPIIENNAPCVQPNILQNNIVPQGTPWNNLINCQDPYKVNKNVSYQTVTRQIIHEQKEIDGVKMINSTQETIVIEPISASASNGQIEEIPKVEPNIVKEQPPLYRNLQNNVKQNGQIKSNQVKIVELPNSSSVCKEKPQQAVAPVVVKNVLENGLKNSSTKKIIKKSEVRVTDIPCKSKLEESTKRITDNIALANNTQSLPKPQEVKKNETKADTSKTNEESLKKNESNSHSISTITKAGPTAKIKKNNTNIRKVVQEEPKITYEITSDDGFSYTTTDIKMAWEKVFETVQKAREAKGLPLLTENPFSSPTTMLKKMMGLGNNSVKYILEQLPGASGCSKYKPMYHQRKLTALEQEMTKDNKGNLSGCARTEQFKHTHNRYDMFSWLASRHRRPPKLLSPDSDWINGSSRRTNMNLPMAMRFRHLKETSNAVGVFRSDIHGRGLFCLRDIDSGEMVIEYAGEVIRSALTDKRERHYTAKGIGCYMFRIDDKFVVDATMKGNAARFINHSCEPNCYSKVVDILGKKHILIFAMRRILQGEELTYDYKFPLEEEKINCHCLSRRCRKYLN
uniref:Histone-lysine N-methyltransferase trithorax n=1 Tax=Triatoma infestans TaxID=30076 RepID=A0A023F0H4_TRIIF